MRLLVVLALVGTALAGCVTPPDGPVPAATLDPVLPGLLAYDATGASVPVPEALQEPIAIVARLLGHRGAEPNVGVTPEGVVFATAGPNTMRSKDHGRTWEVVFNLTEAFPAPVWGTPASQVARSSDPMLWVDAVTGRVFTNHMTHLLCANMIVSDDEGESWTMKPMTCGLPVNDHQKVATSIGYGPKAKVPNPVYPNAVYYCYNKLVSTQCAVSHDGGYNFLYDRTVASGFTDGCGGINGHPAPHPDGTMLVPMTLGCDGPVVGVTEDNGLTWTVR
ncbi:MAG TPA: sialidase family protein, partial [Candidatus Thermoplasmatota archaeon]|nr:sialidase family protein [Candidatus Thermoplasmatota archaeon]